MENERSAETSASASASASPATGTGDEGFAAPPAAGAPKAEALTGQAHNLRFEAYVGVAYYAAREHVLSRRNKVATGAQVFLQTSAAAALATGTHNAVWLAALGAFVGVCQLVFDPGNLARDQRLIRQRYNEVVAVLEEAEDSASVSNARRMLRAIRSDTPPAYTAAHAIAFNRALAAICSDETYVQANRLHVPFYIKPLAHLLLLQGWSLRTEAERADEKRRKGKRLDPGIVEGVASD